MTMNLIVLINIVGWGSGFGWLATCVLRAREESAAYGYTTTARRACATPDGGGMAGASRQGGGAPAARPAPLPLDSDASRGAGRHPQTRKRPAMTGGPITETNRSVIR